MGKKILLLVLFSLSLEAHALRVFNLNVFDQLQGTWDAGFRERRLKAINNYLLLSARHTDLVVLQEARSLVPGGREAFEGEYISFPHKNYVSEMTGADGFDYGYWMGSAHKPAYWLEDGFSFPGGVKRRVQAAIFNIQEKCLGVLSLHMSYQNTAVRQLEAQWLLEWLKREEKQCPQWLVLGDFNADAEDKEMQILFEGGLKSLFTEKQPTIGAYNPIRRIYGENIPSRTIDWALGWNLEGSARVVLNEPIGGVWVSDHAAIEVDLPSF